MITALGLATFFGVFDLVLAIIICGIILAEWSEED